MRPHPASTLAAVGLSLLAAFSGWYALSEQRPVLSLSPLSSEQTWWVWNLLGRGPAFLVLLLMGLGARHVMSGRAVIVGLSGFAAGASVGTALMPSILGALGGGVTGALATWRFVRAQRPGPLLPVTLLVALMAVGRWGCLLVGCCFGRPTAGTWGVTYGEGSLAHLLHQHEGLVGPDAATSAAVIPTQALESVALLALLGATFLLRRRFRSEVQHALVLIAGVLLVRAAIDPLRAMVNTWASVMPLGALSRFQSVALIGAVMCLLLALRTPPRRARVTSPESDSPFRWTFAFGLQALAVAATLWAGTPFLRALTLASLALAGGVLALTLMGGRRVLVVAATLALVPVGLWAEKEGRTTRANLRELEKPTGTWSCALAREEAERRGAEARRRLRDARKAERCLARPRCTGVESQASDRES